MAKILLIEDQRLWQKTFFDLLNREGHEVILAGSYEEAEVCINAEPDIGLQYDVILLDLMLDEWNQELQGKALIPRIQGKTGQWQNKSDSVH